MKIVNLEGATFDVDLTILNHRTGYVCRSITLGNDDLTKLASMDDRQMVATIRQLSGRLQENRILQRPVQLTAPEPEDPLPGSTSYDRG